MKLNMKVIDVNLHLGYWPFQKFEQDTAAKMVKHLKNENIGSGIISSTTAVFYPNPEFGNTEAYQQVKKYKHLHFVPIVNLRVNNWHEIIGRYSSVLCGIKVIPNYHWYSLATDPRVDELCRKLIELKIPLLVHIRYEDRRSHHPLAKIPDTPWKDISEVANKYPSLNIVALSAYVPEARELVKTTSNVYFDISSTENGDTLYNFVKTGVPAERILFGSHAPFYYIRSAYNKVLYSQITGEQKELVAYKNAEKVFNL
ncbi:MAG: amidohydrolase family protein [Elusimicrobiota bacterium]